MNPEWFKHTLKAAADEQLEALSVVKMEKVHGFNSKEALTIHRDRTHYDDIISDIINFLGVESRGRYSRDSHRALIGTIEDVARMHLHNTLASYSTPDNWLVDFCSLDRFRDLPYFEIKIDYAGLWACLGENSSGDSASTIFVDSIMMADERGYIHVSATKVNEILNGAHQIQDLPQALLSDEYAEMMAEHLNRVERSYHYPGRHFDSSGWHSIALLDYPIDLVKYCSTSFQEQKKRAEPFKGTLEELLPVYLRAKAENKINDIETKRNLAVLALSIEGGISVPPKEKYDAILKILKEKLLDIPVEESRIVEVLLNEDKVKDLDSENAKWLRGYYEGKLSMHEYMQYLLKIMQEQERMLRRMDV